MAESWEFDPEQAAAVSIGPCEKQIVLAGPGSGKTEVVAGLLHHLTEDEGLSGTDEVLVISFSRAAVAAVQARTRQPGLRRAAVTVRTLDSLAARVLDDLADDDEWRHTSFDSRVVRATRLLQQGRSHELEALQHVVVDEVQDVVGVRAEFLLVVLDALGEDAGFTLLGDPMQAVYDFQLDSRSKMTSGDLLDLVRGRDGVVERRLQGQYRARWPGSREAFGMGARLLSLPSPRSQACELEATVSRLPTIGELSALGRLVPRWQGPTAVLCRTNGEALVAARQLREAGLRVSLQRAAQEAGVASWVAEVLADQPSNLVTRDALIASASRSSLVEESLTWMVLRDLAGSRSSAVDVFSVARRIASGVVPVDLRIRSDAPVVVSTIHRAKGLEFNNVVLVGPETWMADREAETLDQDVRATFVAVTRARDRIVTAQAPDVRRLWPDRRCGRWVRSGSQAWMTLGFELLGSDTRVPVPVGDNPAATQAYLWQCVHEGDETTLELDPRRATLQRPVYSVFHGGRLVGRTSEAFGETLVRRIGTGEKRKGRPWPELSGAVVEAVETVAGPPQPPDSSGGVGRWGLWLNVRLNGMVDLAW